MVRRPLQAFVDNGFVVVSFDSRHSFGASDGSLEFATLSSFVEDLKTVIDWAARQPFMPNRLRSAAIRWAAAAF